MQPEPYDFEVVWLTSGTRGVPHRAALAESNPGLVVHVWTAAVETGLDGWRNCDRNIREYWQHAGETVKAERILFLEYDVLVTCDLRTIFPRAAAVYGIEGCNLKMPVRDARSWRIFDEIDRLPRPMQAYACGLAPLAILMISSEALAAAADAGFDELFARDIFCELRLPTVIRWAGFACSENAALRQVGCGPMAPGKITTPGIYHAVKTGGDE